MREPLPPVAAVLSFIDCINRGGGGGLGALMTHDHELGFLTEPPVVGRDANVAAWNGYARSFPEYIIYSARIAEKDGKVAVLGHTTGSHLALPDERESKLLVLWVAEVHDGKLSLWSIVRDTPENRQKYGLA
jgi:hypothetical protein